MKKLSARFLFFVVSITILGLGMAGDSWAQTFPWAKNKFGLHLLDNPADITPAAQLINNHGDWGWVVFVLRDNDLAAAKWQDIFDRCRRKHLIPLVRLATHAQGPVWAKPDQDVVRREINFLQQLLWPTEARFLIVFNEPNRGDEWGGKADPNEYGQLVVYLHSLLRQSSKQFYLLGPALDLAAPQKPPLFYSPASFYRQLAVQTPHFWQYFSGLASHSYPNHGFRGKPSDWGVASIHGYRWELQFLHLLGMKKELPVFITETGWPHREGQKEMRQYLAAAQLGPYFHQAFTSWLNDPRVIAFTPFVFSYSLPPLDHFSWRQTNEKYYPYVNVFRDWQKGTNRPPQFRRAKILEANLPLFVLRRDNDTFFRGTVLLENKGQTIWLPGLCFSAKTKGNTFSSLCGDFSSPIEPGQQGWFHFQSRPRKQGSFYCFRWQNLDRPLCRHILTAAATNLRRAPSWLERQCTYLRQLLATFFKRVV